jgi:toxin ParE1/3/4
MNQYIISPEAIRDLEEILDYLAVYNISTGDRLLDEFANKCRYLTKFPLMGRSYSEIRGDLRALPLQNYLIFYRTVNSDIEIVRIIKGNRDLEAIFADNS